MKIHELEIVNLRGVRSLTVHPAGENMVVLGPNGSGKSTVVDAIDFLLTGRIGRLTGRGSGSLSLAAHGTHIESRPEEAYVRAIISIPGSASTVEISRCIGRPSQLVCDEEFRPPLAPVLEHAKRGQHILTRRDILQYIVAEPRHRADLVQALLNLSDIEESRARIVRSNGRLDRDSTTAEGAVSTARGRVAIAAGVTEYDQAAVLEVINHNRAVLGGLPLNAGETGLHVGLSPPSVDAGSAPLNRDLIQRDLVALTTALRSDEITRNGDADDRLRQTINTVRANPDARRAADNRRLAELGIRLLDESGDCPLCGAMWPPGELNEALCQRIADTEALTRTLENIERDAQALRDRLSVLSASALNVASASTHLYDDSAVGDTLVAWAGEISRTARALDRALDDYSVENGEHQTVSTLLERAPTEALLHDIDGRVQVIAPQSTPEQTAWDALTRLAETLNALADAERQHASVDLAKRRAEILLHTFTATRDEVLGNLYDSVRNRFVELYCFIHGEDEESFSASLTPAGAGLDLTVGFHGQGAFPPHALHSEGHQDSMGLCMYLALSERLASESFELIVLDDVVMSVDADHRRKVSDMLPGLFAGKQFLITTHDRTWAHQLRSNGVVDRRGTLEFYDWSLGQGPHVHDSVDQWGRIEEDLRNRDVSAASQKLRRASEEYFSSTCEMLEAQVPYRSDGRYDLGTYLDATIGAYKRLLSKGKQAARSWGNAEALRQLEEMESTVGQTHQRTNAERWPINAALHYNAWADLAPDDFRPVVEAFRDLFDHLRCRRCNAVFRVRKERLAQVALGCTCGQVNYSLVPRAGS